jgi:ankyrin repeat protein
MLIDAGANIKARDSKGREPIHYACYFEKETKSEGTAIVKILTEVHGELDTQDDDGNTPLACAILSGDPRCVKRLLSNGAHFEAGSYEGNHLQCAAFLHDDQTAFEILKAWMPCSDEQLAAFKDKAEKEMEFWRARKESWDFLRM